MSLGIKRSFFPSLIKNYQGAISASRYPEESQERHTGDATLSNGIGFLKWIHISLHSQQMDFMIPTYEVKKDASKV
jgi:hypothetical protein